MDLRFNQIANTYEAAITKYPFARTDDKWLLDHLELKPTDRVLEFTSGTGFLTRQLVERVPQGRVVAQDIADFMIEFNRRKCAAFNNVWFYIETDSKFPALAEESFEKAVCLGGFHHVQNQAEYLQTVYKKLKKGGVLCVGDFADMSPVQAYFDERINYITAGGHIGLFLTTSLMENLGRCAGFSRCETVRTQVPFIFDSELAVGEFYQLVHGLNQRPEETLEDVRRYMGIKHENGKLVVPMDYVYARYTK